MYNAEFDCSFYLWMVLTLSNMKSSTLVFEEYWYYFSLFDPIARVSGYLSPRKGRIASVKGKNWIVLSATTNKSFIFSKMSKGADYIKKAMELEENSKFA